MTAIPKKSTRTRRTSAIDTQARGLVPTDEQRRDRWRREAGTATWHDETGDRSGAPAPSPA
jgi:hypothetical protein